MHVAGSHIIDLWSSPAETLTLYQNPTHPAWFFGSGKEISVDMSVEADWRVSECGWKTGPCHLCIVQPSTGQRWRVDGGGAHSLQQQEEEGLAANNRRSALAP